MAQILRKCVHESTLCGILADVIAYAFTFQSSNQSVIATFRARAVTAHRARAYRFRYLYLNTVRCKSSAASSFEVVPSSSVSALEGRVGLYQATR